MTSGKRGRGRPRGCSYPNDWKLLDAVADRMISYPPLRRTTAIKEVLGKWTESDVKRLMRNWNAYASDLIAKAEARRDRTNLRRLSGAAIIMAASKHPLSVMHKVWKDHPLMRSAFVRLNESSVERALRQIAERLSSDLFGNARIGSGYVAPLHPGAGAVTFRAKEQLLTMQSQALQQAAGSFF